MLSSKTLGLILLCISNASSLQFTPYDTTGLADLSFFEQFLYDSVEASPWLPSQGLTYDQGRDEVVKYTGQWAIEESLIFPAFEGDRGLVMKSKASHYAISRALSEPFNNTDQLLVLQYEVKLQKGLNCGGAYIKLLNTGHNLKYFRSTTPFQIMFGPDRCGHNDKVHFIMSRTNPNTHETSEKHLVDPPLSRFTDLTTLYTLIIHANQDYEMRINGKVAKAGNLIADPNAFDPPLNPPAEIVDLNDEKPLDWDDRKYIPDPDQLEPSEEYMIRHANVEIPDPHAKRPQSWLENEAWFIPDTNASKPSSWDDDKDGEWPVPQIVNPKCTAPGISGCGPWSPPTIFNAEYIGPYFPPEIENPNYMGEWEPRLIANPDYYEDSRPSDLENMVGAIAFELWGMDAGVLFDNIYLGHSVKEAEQLGNATFVPKYQGETRLRASYKPSIKHEPHVPPPDFSSLIAGEKRDFMAELVQFAKALTMQYAREMKVTWLRVVLEISMLKRPSFKRELPTTFHQAGGTTRGFFSEFLKDMHDMYLKTLLNPLGTFWEQPVKFIAYCCLITCLTSFAFGIGSVVMFVMSTSVLSKMTGIEHQREPIKNGEDISIRLFVPDQEEVDEAESGTTTSSQVTDNNTLVKRKC